MGVKSESIQFANMSESHAKVAGPGDAVDVQAKHLMDITFKYTWRIENYLKVLEDGINMDSPPFQVSQKATYLSHF